MGRHLRRGSAKPGGAANKGGIREHVAQHLPRCKVPRRAVFQAALPKNWTVKVQQRPLREEFASPRAA
jgi:acyl-coenzyme A synthetase/AMP-(fatty) acid ligase